MKLGRRKFFGLAGAVAIGGRKVATDVLADMGGGMSGTVGGYASGLQGAINAQGPMDYYSSLQAQAAKMTALKAVGISPIIRDFFRDWNGAPEVNLDDINALVSVSVSAKKRMIRERMTEQQFDNWLNGPSRQLKRESLKREIGVNFGLDF